MKKTNAFQFFNKDYSVTEYSDMYKKLRLDIRYPANVKREQIFVNLQNKNHDHYQKRLIKRKKVFLNLLEIYLKVKAKQKKERQKVNKII